MGKEALSVIGQIPFLLYHDISELYSDEYTISPSLFARHLGWLKKEGYRTYFLRDISGGKTFGDPKSVVITFDDGYASFMDFAFPLLREFGFKSTINIIGRHVGSSVTMGTERAMLTWGQYRLLKKSGLVDLGCHTYNLHEWNLWKGDITEGVLGEDLNLFQNTLSAKTGERTDILAWPYGIYDRKRMETARSAGFRYLLTSNKGYLKGEEGFLEIPRQNANNRFGLDKLDRFLSGRM